MSEASRHIVVWLSIILTMALTASMSHSTVGAAPVTFPCTGISTFADSYHALLVNPPINAGTWTDKNATTNHALIFSDQNNQVNAIASHANAKPIIAFTSATTGLLSFTGTGTIHRTTYDNNGGTVNQYSYTPASWTTMQVRSICGYYNVEFARSDTTKEVLARDYFKYTTHSSKTTVWEYEAGNATGDPNMATPAPVAVYSGVLDVNIASQAAPLEVESTGETGGGGGATAEDIAIKTSAVLITFILGAAIAYQFRYKG